jgi:glycosyltransferase involved in cell wall biosynthesis
MITPTVSVIIPAYNQGRYLGAAIESALAQTYRNFEILVIDDGSTDDTRAVADQFGDRLRYIRQNNQGLAAARNTGIRSAAGQYIALLDSDDEWLPTYLATMVDLAYASPEAAVFYCRARCMDADGIELRQILGGPIEPRQSIYQTLLRYDFLIPSTVFMLRSAAIEAGLFDQSLRSCEDWDLWLRLSPRHNFVGSLECLVRYRVHSSSLSADLRNMHEAAQTVIRKHFGDDDEQPQLWSMDKRRAYGGLYRYQALSAVLRKSDWNVCALHLLRAFAVDPTLTRDQDLFFDLAMGPQPIGYRLTASQLDLAANATDLFRTLGRVFETTTTQASKPMRRVAYGTAYLGLGLVAYNTGQTALCRRYLLRAVRYRPELSRSRLVTGDILKSFVGPRLMSKLKANKGSFGLS